jgi:hypothetical protein
MSITSPSPTENGKRGAVKQIRLTANHNALIIELRNGKTYLFEPTKKQVQAYLEASAVSNEELEDLKNWETPDLIEFNFREKHHLAQYYQKEWGRINLKETSLPRKVEKIVNHKTRFVKAKFQCLTITKAYFGDNVQRVVIGFVNQNPIMIKGTTLKECVCKIIDKIKKEYETKSMSDLRKEANNG